MARKSARDQRKHPRFPSQLPVVSILDTPEPFEMESVNLSLGGVYCTSSREVPVMTKLQVTLYLPTGNGLEGRPGEPIRAEAVVVRAVPGEGTHAGKYEVALFFSRMDPKDRVKLAAYLDLRRKERE